MIENLEAEIGAYESELVSLRHDIHQHPELGFQETRTADLIARELERYGLQVTTGIAGTGVVGALHGRRAGTRTIALRADMDGLPILEANTFAYASRNSGAMHACGHDGHIAMLLGAARYLARHRDFGGSVYFIFQPAEESLGGARVMIEEGLFDRFPCEAVYGMHNAPFVSAGRFAIRRGAMMAASDTWEVRFCGTGGHGGMGIHRGTDPTIPAGQFLSSIQTIIGRNVLPADSAVLSTGYVCGGAIGAPNVVPSEVLVRGTARSFSAATRATLEVSLERLARSLATAFSCSANYTYFRRYPPLVNADREVSVAIRAAGHVVGTSNVDADVAPSTGGEDFAFMLEKKPGAYIFIGGGGSGATPSSDIHTATYDFNDQVIRLGVSYWIHLVYAELAPAAVE